MDTKEQLELEIQANYALKVFGDDDFIEGAVDRNGPFMKLPIRKLVQAYLTQCQEVDSLRLQVQYLAQIARIVEKAKAIRTNNE